MRHTTAQLLASNLPLCECTCQHHWLRVSKHARSRPHPNDPLQEGEGLVDGGVRVKAVLAVLELVMQDDFQALRQAVRLFLQPQLLLMQSKGVLLQFLILPAFCGRIIIII